MSKKRIPQLPRRAHYTHGGPSFQGLLCDDEKIEFPVRVGIFYIPSVAGLVDAIIPAFEKQFGGRVLSFEKMATATRFYVECPIFRKRKPTEPIPYYAIHVIPTGANTATAEFIEQ